MTGSPYGAMILVALLCAGLATTVAASEPVDISDGWKLNRGDDPAWADPGFDDSDWQPVEAGTDWAGAGSDQEDYDGFGWYRLAFRLQGNLPLTGGAVGAMVHEGAIDPDLD